MRVTSFLPDISGVTGTSTPLTKRFLVLNSSKCMWTGCVQAEPPTLLLMSHRSVVPLRMQWAGCSASKTQPRGPSNGLLTLNSRGGTGVVPAGHAGSRTNCHSQSLSTAGSSGYSVSTDGRSEEHTSELQSLAYLVCRLLLE